MNHFANLSLQARPYVFFVLDDELCALELVFEFLELLGELLNRLRFLLLDLLEHLLGDQGLSLSLISLVYGLAKLPL